MNHLVIDDVREFKEHPGGMVCYGRTTDDALSLTQQIDEPSEWHLWLDHDLGEDAAGAPIDVRPFVSWLAEEHRKGLRGVFGALTVHTSNPAGRAWIIDMLIRYYPSITVRFAWEVFKGAKDR